MIQDTARPDDPVGRGCWILDMNNRIKKETQNKNENN
jgi:hypothetical protein